MKAFWTYTLARLVVFAVSLAVVWAIASIWLEPSNGTTMLALIIALAVSALVSFFLLAGLREKLAISIHERATRMTERLEEARRAEDVD